MALRNFCLAWLLLAVTTAWGDVASGPAAGSDIKALTVTAVTGDFAGKKVDYAADRGDKPTVYVFIPLERFDRPVGRFLKKLDESVKGLEGKTTIVAVFLTDDLDATTTRLKAVQNSLQLGATALAVYPSLKELPDGWGINTDASVTAVVAAGKKVTANFAYNSVNETVVPEVLKEIEKSLPSK